jgi:hypothetical protein
MTQVSEKASPILAPELGTSRGQPKDWDSHFMSSYYRDLHMPDRVGAYCASIIQEKIAEYVPKLLVLALLHE